MSERKLTLFELHFHSHGDVQVGPETVNTGGRMEGRKGLAARLRGGTGSDGGETGRTGLPIPLAAGGVALLALAAVTWKLVRGR